jgi:integrase
MTFKDGLWEAFEQMMSYRKATGYATATYRCSVPPFINYCASYYADATVITQDMVDGWLASCPYSTNSRAVFVSLLREYTKYLHFLGRGDFIPDDDYSTKRIAFNPYIFTDDDPGRLFAAFDGYVGSGSGKRLLPEAVLPVYSRFLFCCGMRPQEPPALLRRDVNLSTGSVYIRQSKRHKDRHIIVSADMLELCDRYDTLAGDRYWFFQKWDGRPYTTSWYSQIWRKLWKKAVPMGRGIPRPYDLRHAFASRNIIRWLEAERDVMELLPYLSAYMGHSELKSTLYYVSMIPQKLRESAKVDWEKLSAIYGRGVSEDED